MNHTELLNKLIAKHYLKSYLEIGVRTPDANFNKIICDVKFGVDPNCIGYVDIFAGKSDEYFKKYNHKWDLIFIDGLHHADQVKRDFDNSLKCLNDNGFIVIHDTCPIDESTTIVPRGTQKVWHGDVYKFAMSLANYDGIDFYTIDQDCGMTVVWKDKSKKGEQIQDEFSFKHYQIFKQPLLKIVDEPFEL